MIIDPKLIIQEGFLVPKENTQIQQSGIDVTLKSIKKLIDIRTAKEIGLEDGVFKLTAGVYDFTCNELVRVPNNCCALLIIRSSYNRKGTFITTGLYDNGFHNYIGGILHVSFDIEIPLNERIAQIVFMQSDGKKLYNGQYQMQTKEGV